jgi:hypothetical protein
MPYNINIFSLEELVEKLLIIFQVNNGNADAPYVTLPDSRHKTIKARTEWSMELSHNLSLPSRHNAWWRHVTE